MTTREQRAIARLFDPAETERVVAAVRAATCECGHASRDHHVFPSAEPAHCNACPAGRCEQFRADPLPPNDSYTSNGALM